MMTAEDRLAELLLSLTPTAGIHPSAINGLSLVRSDEPLPSRIPVIYEPCIYIVVQGSKSALLGSEEFIYDAFNYLVLSVPLPLECRIIQATPEQPYLAVKVDIDSQMLTEIEEQTSHQPQASHQIKALAPVVERGVFVSQLNQEIKSTLYRLLNFLKEPLKAKVLAQGTIKELLFYVLQGAQGEQLRAFAYQDRKSYQIARVINFIQQHFSENLEVADLAAKANMSHSSFHANFKAVTSASPIQYIKSIRLHAARRKMLFDNHSASDAAFQVGYASPSQFSREYRRLFGVPPSEDMRAALVD